MRAAWPLIESAAEWETSSLRMKDEKKRCDSEGTGTTAVLQRVLLLAAAVSFFFSPLVGYRSGERGDTKNARGEKALL